MKQEANPWDSEAIANDWGAVGRRMFQALGAVAQEKGGIELRRIVEGKALSDHALPDPQALFYLNNLYPEAASQVVDRAEQIQDEEHEKELKGIKKAEVKIVGRNICQDTHDYL
jgi:hypothetical protein